MSNLVWYRSLYWRIALGFVLLLAILLAAQGLVFLWLTGRVAAQWFGRSASELAQAIAGDVATEVARNPDTDIDVYVNTRFQGAFRSFVVVMRDGQQVSSRRVQPPPQLDRNARTRLFTDAGSSPDPGAFRRGGPPDRWSLPGPGGPDPGRGPSGGSRAGPQPGSFSRGGGGGFGGGPRGPGRGGDGRSIKIDFATVTIAGKDAGIVAVPTDPPPLWVTVQDLWPTLLTVALSLLVAGTALGAMLVFRPTHRRLRSVQQAALALGAGDTSIRAPETGGDEVTALAHAFNQMAGQLEQRTNALETVDRTRRQLLADVHAVRDQGELPREVFRSHGLPPSEQLLHALLQVLVVLAHDRGHALPDRGDEALDAFRVLLQVREQGETLKRILSTHKSIEAAIVAMRKAQ
jgi:HAMP domain-containing protein